MKEEKVIRKILIFILFMLMMMFLSAQDLLKKTIVYTVPGMEKITIHKNITYKTVDGEQLKMDIYMPPVKDKTQRYPVVIFVHGGPIMASMTPPKEWGVFTSYGRLAAASGLVGVTFNHRYYGLYKKNLVNSLADVKDVINLVTMKGSTYHINSDQICLWAFSGAGYHLSIPLKEKMTNVRCLVAYYAIMNLKYFLSKDNQVKMADILEYYTPVNYLENKEFPFPPVLIASAGKDAPPIKKSIQEFINESFKVNILIDFLNHPEGFHGFDVLNDDERSKDILKRTIQFIKGGLL
jgi:hypothetical protein